jgi:hypothetical protein
MTYEQGVLTRLRERHHKAYRLSQNTFPFGEGSVSDNALVKAIEALEDKGGKPFNESDAGLKKSAIDLFDNRLGWDDGRHPYAPRELWANLGASLYGEEDERVKELRPPKPKFKIGDWIVYQEYGIACLVVYMKDGIPYVFDPRNPYASVARPMDLKPIRLATQEEIDKAVNGD